MTSQKRNETSLPNFFDADPPRFFSVDPGRPFLKDLTEGLLTSFDLEALHISDAEIFLPTRRAARALGETFFEAAKARGEAATLLPRIRPIGDVDEDTLSLFLGDAEDELELLPPVSAMERKLVLAQMVAQKDEAYSGQKNWFAALSAANELAKILDSFYTEEIPFSSIKSLVPDRFAEHWQQSLKFLEIVTDMWPAYLQNIGRSDPSMRRAQLIHAQADRFADTCPAHPIIIAGTTGSAPSVARLMSVVAQLPKGSVILPGFDRKLASEHGWDQIDAPHPQAGLKSLLEKIDIPPAQIIPWHNSGSGSRRSSLLSLALRPASATDDWRHLIKEETTLDPNFIAATQGLRLIDAADEEEEANAIALLMRETLETPKKTAMLVTPDRDLSRRVAAKMRRWDVLVDDSAGVPFHNSQRGTFLRLVAQWLCEPKNCTALVALLRHPLARNGLGAGEAQKTTNLFDSLLRGLEPPGSALLSLQSAIGEVRNDQDRDLAANALNNLNKAFDGWASKAATNFADLLDGHMMAAEIIAATPDMPGGECLWQDDDGQAATTLIADLREANISIAISRADYPSIFTQIVASTVTRRRTPAHPQLSILGPLEARLQTADLVILGGLNEGIWPGDAAIDPFLSRPMRQEINLPSPERRIGLSAHDFAQLAASDDVVLTRAGRTGGTPTKPSRWIVRLRNIISGTKGNTRLDQSQKFAYLSATLDAPDHVAPVGPPKFAPPLAARPKSLYVTRIGKLLRDPYGVYASQILKLRKRDKLGEPFAARHLGELFHTIFELFANAHPTSMPKNPKQELQRLFDEHAPRYGYGAFERAFWGGNAEETLSWFADFHEQSLSYGAPVIIEGEGACEIEIAGETFTLKARADRIDAMTGRDFFVFDYKSKSMPSFKQIKSDFNPQLPLTALIAEQGGFQNLNASKIGGFYYLRFLQRHNDEKKNKVGATGDDARAAVRDAELGLRTLIDYYQNPDTCYLSQPRPEFTDDWGDYDHLARRREWSTKDEGS